MQVLQGIVAATKHMLNLVQPYLITYNIVSRARRPFPGNADRANHTATIHFALPHLLNCPQIRRLLTVPIKLCKIWRLIEQSEKSALVHTQIIVRKSIWTARLAAALVSHF